MRQTRAANASSSWSKPCILFAHRQMLTSPAWKSSSPRLDNMLTITCEGCQRVFSYDPFLIYVSFLCLNRKHLIILFTFTLFAVSLAPSMFAVNRALGASSGVALLGLDTRRTSLGVRNAWSPSMEFKPIVISHNYDRVHQLWRPWRCTRRVWQCSLVVTSTCGMSHLSCRCHPTNKRSHDAGGISSRRWPARSGTCAKTIGSHEMFLERSFHERRLC